MAKTMALESAAPATDSGRDYSETNIQVEGVDEPDVVKTDGTYLYILADSKLYIIKAHPAEKATVLSIISFKDDVYVRNFFINKDRLFVFGTSQRYPPEYEEYKTSIFDPRD